VVYCMARLITCWQCQSWFYERNTSHVIVHVTVSVVMTHETDHRPSQHLIRCRNLHVHCHQFIPCMVLAIQTHGWRQCHSKVLAAYVITCRLEQSCDLCSAIPMMSNVWNSLHVVFRHFYIWNITLLPDSQLDVVRVIFSMYN